MLSIHHLHQSPLGFMGKTFLGPSPMEPESLRWGLRLHFQHTPQGIHTFTHTKMSQPLA